MERYAPRTTFVEVFIRTFPMLKSTLSTDQWPPVLFRGALASWPAYFSRSMPPNSMLAEPSEPAVLKSKAKLCISETVNGAGNACAGAQRCMISIQLLLPDQESSIMEGTIP